MTITTRTAKGSALTIAELDGNFTDLNGRVAALEAAVDEPPPMEIDSDVTGNQWTLTINGNDYVMTIPQASYAPPATATQSGATLLLSALQANKYTRCTNASGCVISINLDADTPIPVDSEMHFRDAGDGRISLSAADGVTINPPFEDATLTTTRKGDTITLKKVDTNVFDWIGPSA